MTDLGYLAISEEHPPGELARHVAAAEERGLDYAMVSDHYHPWIRAQGQSPFVWSVLGAIAERTDEIVVGTAVTAPIIRIHPAIVAQAAATAATQLEDRFIFGVGTGENLNEHVVGERWPPHDQRIDMLEEATRIIRLLWEGGTKTYRGEYYTVENARLFTRPDSNPPIVMGAGGPRAATAAGGLADGLIATAPDPELIEQFGSASENDPTGHYGQLHVCYAADKSTARETAYDQWPNAALSGELSRELPSPAHFEQAVEMIDADDVAESVLIGNDPADYIDAIEEFVDAGYEGVHLHQIGSSQESFLDFYRDKILPAFT